MRQAVPSGRVTAAYDGDVVVFLIGFRVNKWSALRAWWPVFSAMPRMLRELGQDPDVGLLGYRTFFGFGQATMVQYWSSVEKLQSFASDPGRTHRPAWLAFYRHAFKGDAVGIWHETYVVPAGSYESIYANVPDLGLGAVTGTVPVGQRGESAADRLGTASAGA